MYREDILLRAPPLLHLHLLTFPRSTLASSYCILTQVSDPQSSRLPLCVLQQLRGTRRGHLPHLCSAGGGGCIFRGWEVFSAHSFVNLRSHQLPTPK